MLKKMPNVLILAIIFAAAAASVLIFRAATYGERKVSLPRKEIVLAGQVFSVEVADDILSRANGLSGRASLGGGDGSANSPHKGMLFIFPNAGVRSFWMKDMNFPIDIVWVSGRRVIGFTENVEPEPGKKLWGLKIYSSPEPVDKVLEVSAGTVSRLGIKIGNEILTK